MKSSHYACALLSMVALPLSADPLSWVALDGTATGGLYRIGSDFRTVTQIASLTGGIALTKDADGYYIVTNATGFARISPTGTVTQLNLLPSGSLWVAAAVDASGAIILVDNHQHAVWKVIVGLELNVVTKVANYPVSDASDSEDAAVVVDASGNYIVLVDNGVAGGGVPTMFSITPAGVVTPISLDGVPRGNAIVGLTTDTQGNFYFASNRTNAIYKVTPAGSARIFAQDQTVLCCELAGLAADPDTGALVVANRPGQIVHVAFDGSFANVERPSVHSGSNGLYALIAETHGALSHLAGGDVWTTAFFAINEGDAPAHFSVFFYNDAGAVATFPFGGSIGTPAALRDTVPAHGMNYYEAANPTGPLSVVWGLISADPTITIQSAFREHNANGSYYEAGVAAAAGSKEFVIPFDASTFAATGAPIYTGFAIANQDPATTANVVCVAADQTGTVIPNGLTVPPLSPLGHYANFVFPTLSGKRGTLDCTSNTIVSAIALRALGTAFSSLPVMYR